MKRIVTGPRAVMEALKASAGSVNAVFIVRDARRDVRDLGKDAGERGVRVEERTSDELDALAKGHKHQGVIAVCGAYVYTDLDVILAEAADPPLIIALDQITDPHNLGAIVRSAVAFGADGVLTLKDRAAPVTPVVVRTSAGATEHARIARITNLARTLKMLTDRGLTAIGLDADGELDLADLPPAPEGRVLVVGAEGKGLRRLVRERCTFLAKIPHPGPVASLNASVAASIALYCASTQR